MNRLTVRFYNLENRDSKGIHFQDALEQIDAIKNKKNREKNLTNDCIVRLERYKVEAGGELSGEFTRVINSDFPFEVSDEGVDALQTNGPLGQGVAFRFRSSDQILLMQYNTQIVSPRRAMGYLHEHNVKSEFIIEPRLNPDNWRKFKEGDVRKLKISIASPDHFEDIENQASSVGQSFKSMGQDYGAASISIEMGMGNRRGALKEKAKDLAESLSGLFGSGEVDVRSLRASVKASEETPVEDVNLIDEVLSEKIELELPINDPDKNYQVRYNYLKRVMSQYGK